MFSRCRWDSETNYQFSTGVFSVVSKQVNQSIRMTESTKRSANDKGDRSDRIQIILAEQY